METLSDSGIFGPGYADTNHSGVVPAMAIALVFFAFFLVVRAIGLWRATANAGSDGREQGSAFQIGWILPLQFAGVYGIECFEALTAGQPFPAGLAWLGGPVLIAVAIHVLVGACCCLAVRSVMAWLLDGVAAVVRVAVAMFVSRASLLPTSAVGFDFRRAVAIVRAQAPHAHQIGGRAPPPFPLPAQA